MNKFSFGRKFIANQARCFASPVKLSASKFINRELKDNPEFYKAFPHLAPPNYNEESVRLQDPFRESPFFETLLH